MFPGVSVRSVIVSDRATMHKEHDWINGCRKITLLDPRLMARSLQR